jgi:signal transduction histidine kinase
MLEIHVHNPGRPIAPELQGRIFEPLQRGEKTVTSTSRSVGLGLYIVREIAIAHGGRVSVQSTEEDGTTFVLSVPRFGARSK